MANVMYGNKADGYSHVEHGLDDEQQGKAHDEKRRKSVDTGAMYRSVTLYAMRNGLFNADGIQPDIGTVFRATTIVGFPQ